MKGCLGIRQETIDPAERRAPLSPQQVEKLIRLQNLRVVVAPAINRYVPVEAYQRAGAIISDDLTGCNLILGIKEVPVDELLEGKAYCFFSHTIKGQEHNMPMLRRILALGCTLLDYEKVKDEAGKRLIHFGRFAGHAGMIDSLWALGRRLLGEGFDTPFAAIRRSYEYRGLEEAKAAVREVGETIRRVGFPSKVSPVTCGIIGNGNVSKGVQEILDLLPVVPVMPADLHSFVKTSQPVKPEYRHAVFKVQFKRKDRLRSSSPGVGYDRQEYLQHPDRYEAIFEPFVPLLTIIMHGAYWEPKYPRLVTKNFMKSLHASGQPSKLKIIGDITCDIEGAIELTMKATKLENPIYVYEPLTGRVIDGWQGEGPVIMAVDKLPTALPREATEDFGKSLSHYIPSLARTDWRSPLADLTIPPQFKHAVITHRGKLAPRYQYLSAFLQR